MDDFEPFHSAVNRIPVLRRSGERLADAGRLPKSLFKDHEPLGHDRLHADRWSGSIDLEMIVRTPLVFGEQKDGNVDLPLDGDGHPIVPPTMVKGMISRAYETLTCSRFRVFGDHSRQLTYRADAANALRLIPTRVIEMNEDGGLLIELLRGDTVVNGAEYNDNGDRPYPVMLAASLQDGDKGHARFAPGFNMDRLRAMTQHERQVRCNLKLCLHPSGGHYAYWQVTHLYDNLGKPISVFDINDSVRTAGSLEDVTGYVYRTAADSDRASQVFQRKHDERVFFDISEQPERISVAPHVVDSYRRVVESYSEQREEKALQKGMRPNRFTNVDPSDLLHVGSLMYALLSEDETRVVELVPTMIGRRPYSRSPRELAAAQGVLPLTKAVEASAADRLFGYVVPDAEDGATGGGVAYRGRLSFGVVDASEASVSHEEKRLSPLLSPKTSSARRFLTDASGATPSKGKNPLPRSEYFAPGQLLGAAAHPVHRGLVQGKGLDGSKFPAQATRAPVLDGREQDNAAVRLTVRSWIETGSVLRCTMLFSNLSQDELAALIWVLTPRNLVPSNEKKDPGAVGYLRMGLGKPFGLGVLEVSIAKNGLRAVRGGDLAESYVNLDRCLGLATPIVGVENFPLPNEALLLKTPWVKAMQRTAFGYSDGRPVRYMSLKENKANNQTDHKTGNPKEGYGQSPTDLSEEPTPINIKNDDQRPGGGTQNHGRRRGRR